MGLIGTGSVVGAADKPQLEDRPRWYTISLRHSVTGKVTHHELLAYTAQDAKDQMIEGPGEPLFMFWLVGVRPGRLSD